MSCTPDFKKFGDGQWAELLDEALRSTTVNVPRNLSVDSAERRAGAAERKVMLGEVSRARQCLTEAALALGIEETFQSMENRRPQVATRPVSQEAREFHPEAAVSIDRKVFLQCLKSALQGSSPGPGGCTYEHLRLLLDEMDTVEFPFEKLICFAQAKVLSDVTKALMGARFTAMAKPDGGVRGIATGSSLRRLVARILTRQFMQEFESECAPFQCALSIRAGTDCVGHFLRVAVDANPRATILSVDGVGVYDRVLRSAMLERLLHMPKARAILPFVRLSYCSPSSYSWEDDAGTQRKVTQAEGGEQGDPLMLLLFFISIHAALEEVASHLEDVQQLCAFLDDVYVLCLPHSVVPLFLVLRESLDRVAGIRLHEGKTKVWNRSGTAPEDIEELGEEAWQPEGLKVLGTPIGSPQITAAKFRERAGEERRFWDVIPTVKNLQCAWQLLL